MRNKSLYELGRLAQKGDDMAILEIIDRKKKMLKRYSFGDEDRYQFIILVINFKIFLKIGENFKKISNVYILKGKLKDTLYYESR